MVPVPVLDYASKLPHVVNFIPNVKPPSNARLRIWRKSKDPDLEKWYYTVSQIWIPDSPHFYSSNFFYLFQPLMNLSRLMA